MIKININDVEKPKEHPDDLMKAMFDKQMQLAIKYQDIEKMGNLLKETATNVDTANGQKWIKDFAWRVTEELCEAKEAYDAMENSIQEKDPSSYIDDHYQHYLEELIDALHFLIELTIISGYTSKIVNINSYRTDDNFNVVYFLGLMCNCLKNKPWKQTQMLTDRQKFEGYLEKTWQAFMGIFNRLDISKGEVYDLYFKKNAVNQFRQRSKY